MKFLYKYALFNDKYEMDEAINKHIKRNQYKLNDTALDTLRLLSQYAVRRAGACQLKVITIAEALDKSERTIYRALNKLADLSIIERINTVREKSGGQGANIYRILPFNSSNVSADMSDRRQAENGDISSDKASDSKNEAINSLSELNNTDDYRRGDKIDKEKLINESIRNNTPAAIVDLLSPYFYGSELYKYIGIIFKAKYHPHIKTSIESNIDAFKATIADVISRYKAGYIRKLDAYMYASIKRLTRRLFFNQSEISPLAL